MAKDKPEVLVEGCLSSEAKSVISQMLTRRIAELDPTGLQAKFIMRLQDELDQAMDCDDMLGGGGGSSEGGTQDLISSVGGRKKSAYQEFIGPCLREQSSDMRQPDKMKACGKKWNEQKEK